MHWQYAGTELMKIIPILTVKYSKKVSVIVSQAYVTIPAGYICDVRIGIALNQAIQCQGLMGKDLRFLPFFHLSLSLHHTRAQLHQGREEDQ